MRRFTIQQLEAFQAIAELGSFRVAADWLGVTQPSISSRVRELETALGRTLFTRSPRGVSLSPDGVIALRYVRRSLDVLDEMGDHLRTSDPLRGTLRLGASNTFALCCLPTILAELETRHPGVKVDLTIANSRSLARWLEDHRLDLAFLVDAPGVSHVMVERLARADIAWFASPTLAGGMANADAVARRRIVTLPPPSPFHAIITRWFAAADLPSPNLGTCNDLATIVRLVASGIAVSVLPLCVVDPETRACALELPSAPPLSPLTLCAAYQTTTRQHVSRTLIEIARKVMGSLSPHLRLLGEEGAAACNSDARASGPNE